MILIDGGKTERRKNGFGRLFSTPSSRLASEHRWVRRPGHFPLKRSTGIFFGPQVQRVATMLLKDYTHMKTFSFDGVDDHHL